MVVSGAFWKVFMATGHVGAYILYKDYQKVETIEQSDREQEKEAMV